MSLTKRQLLAEVEGLLRAIPPRADILTGTPSSMQWRGTVAAVLEQWTPGIGLAKLARMLRDLDDTVFDVHLGTARRAYSELSSLLNEARYDLQMQTGGPSSLAIEAGHEFAYFDRITQRIELATLDILFIDPYLDAEFVRKYLPQVGVAVTTRLLTGPQKIPSLLPAVETFARQSGLNIEVREARFHDRFVFIDRKAGLQSGSSFKDGAKRDPTALIEILDVFPQTLAMYEALWSNAKVHR